MGHVSGTKDRRVSNPGVKVVGTGLGKRRSEGLSDSRGLASELRSGVAARREGECALLDLGSPPAADLSEIVVGANLGKQRSERLSDLRS